MECATWRQNIQQKSLVLSRKSEDLNNLQQLIRSELRNKLNSVQEDLRWEEIGGQDDFCDLVGCLMSRLRRLCSPSAEQLSAQCVDQSMALKAVIVYGDQEFPITQLLQVEDNHWRRHLQLKI
ncbi:hypothetical protein KOW79_015695 [Hemibagrus wyckioides]|uniref:Uncharacterized protein n=1 Tax=Hemibagrus wyckioides TaxID=337641 RepID=A0A9D3NFP3_9TELE|nr:hypothetical protein KOW79_015695 [Hemibagrus wyckioides]